MKKFQFSLGRMLTYKEQIKTAERNKLAQCNHRKNEIEDNIKRLADESEALARKLSDIQKSGTSMQEIKLITFQIENNRAYIEQLKLDLEQAIIAVEKQLKVVVAATQEVEGLEKLKTKQHDEFLYEENKAEQLVVSEFVASKIIRESKG